MAFQDSPVRKTKAIVVYPMAQATWTPTPYCWRLFPKHTSLMNEKHKVMAGFVPNPTRKSPIPIILWESAMQVSRTEIVPIPQAILIASLLPKLSAI